MSHLIWVETNVDGPGPAVYRGYWASARCFTITYRGDPRNPGFSYVLTPSLPGFQKALQPRATVESAKAEAERIVEIWVANRGLSFSTAQPLP